MGPVRTAKNIHTISKLPYLHSRIQDKFDFLLPNLKLVIDYAGFCNFVLMGFDNAKTSPR